MNLYRSLIFPALRILDAEDSHNFAVWLLERLSKRRFGQYLLKSAAGSIPNRTVEVFGLSFPNLLGVAAGFDKDIRCASGLALLGFGHVEVGTVTPVAQSGNPRPRVFRLNSDQALINHMGFPNPGAAAAAAKLKQIGLTKRDYVIGASIGKQKDTPLAEAFLDYLAVMKQIYSCSDYLAVNVSSPNTPGLRLLQKRRYLEELLGQVVNSSRKLAIEEKTRERPILIKVSPDLTTYELEIALEAAERTNVSGIIATNTTLDRSGIRDPNQVQAGGLSGRPLSRRSNHMIEFIHQQTSGRLPIIGVGGVFSPDDVKAKLDAGAKLVQMYTGIVYQGPSVAGQLLRTLANGRA